MADAKVESCVWPTSLDPAVVGFDADSGILALANDGAEWHSHWVVLVRTTPAAPV